MMIKTVTQRKIFFQEPQPESTSKASGSEKMDIKPLDVAATSQFLPATTTAQDTPTPSTPSGSTTKKKSRVDKPEKDVNAPKKPANAFLKFCQQQRQFVQEQYKKVIN